MKRYLRFLFRFMRSGFVQFCLTVFLFACMFTFAMFQGGFTSWFIFYAFSPVVAYIFFLMVYPLRSIKAERQICETRLSAGDTAHVHIKLTKRWVLPLLLITIRDGLPDSARSPEARGKAVILLWIKRSAVVTYSIPNMKRGEHLMKDIQLDVGDPFGFFQRTIRLNCRTVLLVFPKIRPLGKGSTRESSFPVHPVTDFDMTRFSGVRAYQPSDRLAWLDWKSTARTNQLVTKQFETVRELHASVVLATGVNESDPIFERSISFTASLVLTLLNDGYTVLLTYSAEKSPLFLQSHAAHDTGKLLQTLAQLTEKEAIKAEDVRFFNDRKNIGFIVSTDLKIAGRASEFAALSRMPQTLFYITEAAQGILKKTALKASSYFSLYLVTDNQFDKLLKAGV
ncbi:DUF58 domain-containing protein [Sporolactobacillus sp. THM7-4]|nr:DUF58 domain-containing protein [Sporolactobacillus sp. THM7-4]